MKPGDIKLAPKLFCESVNIGYTKDYFVFCLNSGSEADVFAFTPQHSKRLVQYLQHQVAEYEKEHGVIATEWRPEIVSPLKRANPPTDLS